MRVRVLVSDESEARFYDTDERGVTLRAAGRITEPDARLHDRDLKSDRPGRVFDRAAATSGRRGATGHHSTGGEHRPHKQVTERFARRIAGELERALRDDEYDRLVVMAGPPFLGLLRKAWPDSVQASVAAEVGKDLVHQGEHAVREHMPPDLFRFSSVSGAQR